MRYLRRQEVVEAIELVGVAAEGRCQRRRVGVLGRLDRSHLDLEPSSEALHPPEDMHRITLAEPLVEELDVVPHASFDATARVGEFEREVRRSVPSASTLFLGDREHAFDGPVLGELGDRGHVSSLWRLGVGTLAAMADAKPFRAVRYTGAAGSLADLVAPPYDVVDEDERAELYSRSPYNVLHVTLPESVEEAGAPLPRLARVGSSRARRRDVLHGSRSSATSVPTGSLASAAEWSCRSRPSRTSPGSFLPHERTYAQSVTSGCACCALPGCSPSRSSC